MTLDPRFPMSDFAVKAILAEYGAEGLERFTNETIQIVSKLMSRMAMTVVAGPLPMEAAPKNPPHRVPRMPCMAYFGKGDYRRLYLIRWDGDEYSKNPRPYWQALGCAMGVRWMRENQPTEFWYSPGDPLLNEDD